MIAEALSSMLALRRHIACAIAVFAVGAVAGTAITHWPDAMLQSLLELARQLEDQNGIQLAAFILLKNALAALVAIYGGFFLGIVPFLAALTNGMVLGRAALLYADTFWLILPHGVFELTAIFMAWGMGFWCAGWVREAPRRESLRRRAVTSLRLFAVIVLPLLTVAAVIEAVGIKLLTGA
jgi:stage II sporulation protein M